MPRFAAIPPLQMVFKQAQVGNVGQKTILNLCGLEKSPTRPYT